MEIENKNIEYRLAGIEKTLAELKDVVIENKMQNRDIADLKEKVKESINAFNAHDIRIRELENKPFKEKAGKWSMITDNLLKIIIGIAITLLLTKIGLQGGSL